MTTPTADVDVLVIGAGQAGHVWRSRWTRLRVDVRSLPGLRQSTRVTRLSRDGDIYIARTSTGVVTARQVVVATGPFQTPHAPALATALAGDVTQLHSSGYRQPGPTAPRTDDN